MPERILVIGAGGFIGHALVLELATAGHQISAVGRTPLRQPLPGTRWETIGLGQTAPLGMLLERIDSVVYLAAASTPASTAGRPLDELELNLRPFLNLLQALQDFSHLPLLYVSSAGALYSGTNDQRLVETDIPKPRSYHGAGKIAAEHFIGAWCRQFGAATTILRPSNVYGPGQQERPGFGIIPHALGAVVRGDELVLRGDGSAARDYLYIDDLIRLCISIISHRMPPGVQTFNAGSGNATTLLELIAQIERVTGQKVEYRFDGSHPVDADRIAVSIDQAHQAVGWQPRVELVEGLKRTWNWYRTTQR